MPTVGQVLQNIQDAPNLRLLVGTVAAATTAVVTVTLATGGATVYGAPVGSAPAVGAGCVVIVAPAGNFVLGPIPLTTS